ncbi:hypothetical protein E0Z10_g3473 [Xylaria hypoxylon]|uniref:SprT-like domain-containing protein n=1 Tax=Xylaria hypoxylon TaxID=37992 RepID=A0A4Z0Z1P5_9PEZI|nr:hypothetical protein E0Z10_g3473 [Xylaria hypoxylon]
MAMFKKKRRMSDGDSEVRPSHTSLPEYAPFQPYNSPGLHISEYKPRELLNFAVKAFYSRKDSDLSFQQRQSRTKFVVIFDNRKKEYGKPFEDKQLAGFQRDMYLFIKHLDNFLFFGCLRRHIELEVAMDTVSAKDPATGKKWESHTSLFIKNAKHFIRIQLNLGRNDRLYDLQTLMGNLVHEVVHAWYMYFSCTCEYCNKDSLNTTGHPSDHHGPLFLMLHRLIVTEIRRWDAVLKTFLADDCPDDEVSRSAKNAFDDFVTNLDVDEKNKYNRLNLEDALKDKALRKNEFADDLSEYQDNKEQQEKYENVRIRRANMMGGNRIHE